MSEKETIQYMQETIEHQNRQIFDLSDMLIMQGKDIKALQKQIQKLQGKLESMDEVGGGSPANLSVSEQAAMNKPPHY